MALKVLRIYSEPERLALRVWLLYWMTQQSLLNVTLLLTLTNLEIERRLMLRLG